MDPVLVTALAGIAGILLGTLGSGLVSLLAERRRERAQARVAAGILRRELGRTFNVLKATLSSGVWWAPGQAPRFYETWAQWGPAFLTGFGRPRAYPVHTAQRAVEGIAPHAERANARRDAAEERLSYLDDGGSVYQRPSESGAAARERAWQEAQAELTEAREGLKLTDEQRGWVEDAKGKINDARREVRKEPEYWEALAQRFARGFAVVLVVAGFVALTVLVGSAVYDSETLSNAEVASAVRTARGAEVASCDAVEKVDEAWKCQLLFVRDARSCNLTDTGSVPDGSRSVAEEDSPRARTLLAQADGRAIDLVAEAARLPDSGACVLEARSFNDVRWSGDPQNVNIDEMAGLETLGISKKEDRTLLEKWKQKLKKVISFKQSG